MVLGIAQIATAQNQPSVYTVVWCQDGGPVDGGFLVYDGGVCADGGLSCQACSNTCPADGGWLDGGWTCASINPSILLDAGGTMTSQPWPTPTQQNITVVCTINQANYTSAYPLCTLQGTNSGDPWQTISGANVTYSAVAGAAADGGLNELNWGFGYARWSCVANADGGLLACIVGNK